MTFHLTMLPPSAMGEAIRPGPASRFELLGAQLPVREIIAMRIIDAATKNGERDPARLYEQALMIFGIEDLSMPFVGVGRAPPTPTYALIAHAA